MRNSRLTLLVAGLLAFLAAPAAAQLIGTDTSPGDSCAGFAAGVTRMIADADQDGANITLICDGSVWQADKGLWADLTGGRIHYGSAGTEQVGVATNDPKAALDVAGEVKIGNTGLACDADRKGGLRWSDAETTIEMCDGTTWRKIAATPAASDCTPDAFSFTDLTAQPLNSLILSNTLNITGIDPGCTVSVTGSGSPEIRVNSGSWAGATSISPGDSLQVRLISSNAVSTERIAAVDVGGTTDNWSVTTKAGNTGIFRTSSRYRGDSLGGIGGAHSTCQTEANNAGYSGLWRALLSNAGINARDLLSIAYPVVRATDGTVVDSIDIWDGALENSVGSGSPAWTGSNSDGTKNTDTCSDWRGSGNGQHGEPDFSSSGWISNGSSSCSSDFHLYCVEQAASLGAILSISPSPKTGMHVFGTGSPAYGDPVTFTVENVGDETSATITTSLSNTTNFEIVTDNCNGNTLAQGAICTVDIRPKATIPGGEGTISGTFDITANNNPSASMSGLAEAGGTRIFKTSNTYAGNALGGIGGAHILCQTEANNAGYSGLWRALLSNASINARDLLSIAHPVIRASDTGITVDSVNIWDGSLENPVGSGGSAWTGSNSDGTKDTTNTCSNWRGSGDGRYGDPDYTSSLWITWNTTSCGSSQHLYCVEQASSIGAVLSISPSPKTGMNVFGTGSPAYGDPVTFTVENVGDETSATITTSLSNTTNFEIVTDNCNGNTLAQGAICTVDIRPKATIPGGEGAISGTFDIAANNNPSASMSGVAEAGATRIFRTSGTYNGNLGGLTGADTLCQADADNAGYGGTWKALLSDDATNVKDRLTIDYPVVRATDGTVVDSISIWDGSLENSVIDSSDIAWTGSNSDGTKNTNTCSNWSGSGNGQYGDPDRTDSLWIAWSGTSCGSSRYLYCVEQ